MNDINVTQFIARRATILEAEQVADQERIPFESQYINWETIKETICKELVKHYGFLDEEAFDLVEDEVQYAKPSSLTF